MGTGEKPFNPMVFEVDPKRHALPFLKAHGSIGSRFPVGALDTDWMLEVLERELADQDDDILLRAARAAARRSLTENGRTSASCTVYEATRAERDLYFAIKWGKGSELLIVIETLARCGRIDEAWMLVPKISPQEMPVVRLLRACKGQWTPNDFEVIREEYRAQPDLERSIMHCAAVFALTFNPKKMSQFFADEFHQAMIINLDQLDSSKRVNARRAIAEALIEVGEFHGAQQIVQKIDTDDATRAMLLLTIAAKVPSPALVHTLRGEAETLRKQEGFSRTTPDIPRDGVDALRIRSHLDRGNIPQALAIINDMAIEEHVVSQLCSLAVTRNELSHLVHAQELYKTMREQIQQKFSDNRLGVAALAIVQAMIPLQWEKGLMDLPQEKLDEMAMSIVSHEHRALAMLALYEQKQRLQQERAKKKKK